MKTKVTNKITTPVFAILALILFGAMNTKAAPGDLDPTFGNGGIVINRNLYGVNAKSIAIQPDGKIVVSGGNVIGFRTVRYLTDGSLDISFGGTGMVLTPVGNAYSHADSVAIQADGKIVVAGPSYDNLNNVHNFALVRYNTDGTLDTSFNGTGIIITSVGSPHSYARSVAIQSDGKIVAFGSSDGGFISVRYDADGSLDASFGGTGIVITPIGSSSGGSSMAIQSDGKIIGAGKSGNSDLAVVRYNPNGSLDTTFGDAGIVIITSSYGPFQTGVPASIQSDGKIVVAGGVGTGLNTDFAIVRLNTNGSLDTSFGGSGMVFVSFGNGSDYVNAIATQHDGKIVAVGESESPNGGMAIARLNGNGSLDATFHSTGKVTFGPCFEAADANAVAIQTDGKIVIGGGSDCMSPYFPFFTLLRYQGGSTRMLHGNGKIAFTSTRDGNREIYAMNADGTNQIRLTNNNVFDDHPKWSPDGKKIAFLSQSALGTYAIFVMNADGTGRTEVTPTIESPSAPGNLSYWGMSWSPDGQQIVFSDVVTANESDLIIVNIDGSNRRTLSPGFYPTWSPDGSKILFVKRGATFRDGTLNTINPDGTGFRTVPITLPNTNYLFILPATWSPDGRNIAFVAGNSANASMFIINSDGSNRQTFVDECGTLAPEGCGLMAALPTWSPNSRSIAFAYSPYSPQIAVRNIGEQPIRFLTNTTTGNNTNPDWQSVSNALADFDGDGRSDISVFRSSDRTWYLNQSTSSFSATQFGLSSDKLTPADYDGDGKTDISVYRDGVWYRINSSNQTVSINQFGVAGDVPVSADFTGDGRAELAIYRNGVWWSLDLTNNQVNTVQFGLATDKPVVADYDGDGRADQAVYRNGEWHLNRSSQGYTVINFGIATDKPVVADYDGDGRADEAVYRDGVWYLLRSSQGFTAFQFGLLTDIPAPADYDGDGKTDVAVFRDGVWYLLQSTNGISIQQFGLANDKPVPAAFAP